LTQNLSGLNAHFSTWLCRSSSQDHAAAGRDRSFHRTVCTLPLKASCTARTGEAFGEEGCLHQETSRALYFRNFSAEALQIERYMDSRSNFPATPWRRLPRAPHWQRRRKPLSSTHPARAI